MAQRIVNKHKKYVSAILLYPEGLDKTHAEILRIMFGDGSVWVVDKTHKGFWAAAQKAGGRGILYPVLATPKVDGEGRRGRQREFKLFNDDDEWFVEIDDPEEGF